MNLQNFVNRVLGRLGWSVKIEKVKRLPDEVEARFRSQESEIIKHCRKFTVIEEFRDDSQEHPMHYRSFECEFSSEQLHRIKPGSILDVGSYRDWLAGLMAHYPVTTIDVRDRKSNLSNETIINQDVRYLNIKDESVDLVSSLHTIEHFGLGRYGDEFDPEGDIKSVKNFLRILRSGGHFIFSVPVTSGEACIAFNSHRIYTMDMVRDWVKELSLEGEVFIKRKPARLCNEEELTKKLGNFDVYCACYKKV